MEGTGVTGLQQPAKSDTKLSASLHHLPGGDLAHPPPGAHILHRPLGREDRPHHSPPDTPPQDTPSDNEEDNESRTLLSPNSSPHPLSSSPRPPSRSPEPPTLSRTPTIEEEEEMEKFL